MVAENVKWEPQCLTFPVAIGKAAVQQLRASNATEDAYSFKVKTTNPKRYSVRPNVGIVLPGQEAKVTVQLPGMKEMPADMNKCKDKFQVLTLKLGSDAAAEFLAMGVGSETQRNALTALWAGEGAKDAVVDKVKCAFQLDSSCRDVPIPEEEPNTAPYSPETVPAGSSANAATPVGVRSRPAAEAPQTPYVETEAAGEDSGPGPSASPSANLSHDERSDLHKQINAALADASRQKNLAGLAEMDVKALTTELEKQRKLHNALEVKYKMMSEASEWTMPKPGAKLPPPPPPPPPPPGYGTFTVLLIAIATFGAGMGFGQMRAGPAPAPDAGRPAGGGAQVPPSYTAPAAGVREEL